MKKSKITLSPPKGGGSNYLKFAEGANKIRVVSEIISGFEGWSRKSDTNTVHRQEEEFSDKQLTELGIEGHPKQFYACIVWNYRTKRFECWVMTQLGIKQSIYDYMLDEDWGEPTQYDITISRKGSGLDTTYSVAPKPHSDFPGDLTGLKYKLDNLYGGGDPLDPK